MTGNASGRTESLASPGGQRETAIPGLEPGAVIGDRYEVRSPLGSGGFSIVYRAFDRVLRREVALKVLRSERLDESSLRRLRREAAVARDASSPCLVRIFDVEQLGGLSMLSMEIVEGSTLRERVRSGPLPIDEVLRVGSMVLRGLGALHAAGVVHRDIKPGNVLLTREGVAKLADFGLALSDGPDESRVTKGGAVVGTTDYASPEQALGKPVDARSDLYSFGALLFELLAGRPPFAGRSGFGALMAHVNEAAPDVRALRSDTPPWLARVVARLLAKAPGSRYQSTLEVMRDLEARRARPRPGRRTVVGAGALAVAVAGVLLASSRTTSRLDRLAPDAEGTGRALDADGRTLWTRPGLSVPIRSAIFRLGGRRMVAAVLGDEYSFNAAADAVLTILDGDTGEVRRSVQLPDGRGVFFNVAPSFRVHPVKAVDLDGDSSDELLVTYVHIGSWPSYTVFYDPLRDDARIILAAAGHHRPAATVDLDGDGRREVLFVGIANRMGWLTGLAAVRVPARARDAASDPRGFAVASTPDAALSSTSSRALLWYCLLPSGGVAAELRVDEARRLLDLSYGEKTYTVGYDGFLPGPFRTPATLRARARDAAYSRLRSAMADLAAGAAAQALTESEAAVAEGRLAGDRLLDSWASRVRARALAASGRLADAEDAFTRVDPHGSPAGLEYDAAVAFLLGGDPRRAASWFRRALLHADADATRPKHPYLEGLVLSLGALGAWGEAVAECARFEGAYSNEAAQASALADYARWRSGRLSDVVLRDFPTEEGHFRYWRLELRAARGEGPQQLLPEVDAELGREGALRAPLRSLRGELLRRAGRAAEALDECRRALEDARALSASDPRTMAHLDLVVARFEQAPARAPRGRS